MRLAMKYAIIEGGKVVNLAVADEPLADNWVASETAQIGGLYDGKTFTPPPYPAPTQADAIAERERRLNADFEFAGKMYQRDRKSLQRITGAATLAGFAVANGAQVGDLRWANPSADFAWIASDNSVNTMDAQTCFAFGQAAAATETAIVFAAKALREMDPIPEPSTWDGWP